jgi:hypothetical protein
VKQVTKYWKTFQKNFFLAHRVKAKIWILRKPTGNLRVAVVAVTAAHLVNPSPNH